MGKEDSLIMKDLRHLQEKYNRCNVQMSRELIRENMHLIMKAHRELPLIRMNCWYMPTNYIEK